MPHEAASPQRDLAYLRDMLDACDRIGRFVKGKTFDDYHADDLLRSAVERQIEIVGEAARRLTDAFRSAHPEIPWRPVIAQRHILAHEYGEIEDDLIWRVATVHIPALSEQIRPLVPDETEA
ncbi:MAG: DUF86 domain-containing protein [Phycisphaerales bacterium]